MPAYRDTVTVLTPATTTVYGQTTVDWTVAPTSTVEPAWVGGNRTTESTADGDKVVSYLACHLLPSTVATPICRVEWRGGTYDIDGELLPFSRRGSLHHYEVALKRVEG